MQLVYAIGLVTEGSDYKVIPPWSGYKNRGGLALVEIGSDRNCPKPSVNLQGLSATDVTQESACHPVVNYPLLLSRQLTPPVRIDRHRRLVNERATAGRQDGQGGGGDWDENWQF